MIQSAQTMLVIALLDFEHAASFMVRQTLAVHGDATGQMSTFPLTECIFYSPALQTGSLPL